MIAKIALDTIAAPCYNNPTTLNIQRPQPPNSFVGWLYDLLLRLAGCGGTYVLTFCAPSFLRPVVSAPRRFCAPSFLPLMASLVISLLLPLAAEAGTYTVTYSGGTITAVGQSPTDPKPAFSAGGGDYGASADVSAGTSSTTTPASCSVTIQGPLTATFTWTHDNATETDATDPPPTAAIVEQDCSAGWTTTNTYHGGTGTGSADSGLPENVSPPAGPSGGSDNTDYSAGAGGTSFHISCAAKATFTGSVGGVYYQGVSGTASVVYHAQAFPVTIIPNGATQDSTTGAYSLLIGQQVSTSLTGVPFTPGTGSTYTWSAGGDTFYTYNEKALSHQLVLLSDDPSYTTSPGFSFYDKSAETVTTTCKAVLICPDKSTLTINPSSQPINVLKPTLTRWDIAEGYVQYNSNMDNGSAYGLYGDLSSTSLTNTNGMIWSNVTVNVPAPFSGNGQCTFTQLVNPDRLAYINGSSTPLVPNNGILGLDGSFDYGSRWNVTATGNGVDDPNQPLYYKTGLTEISASDAFTTYVMYQPNSGVWVPLEKISWTWGATLDWQPQTSQFSLTASYPATAGQAPTPTHVPTTDPPQWTVTH